MPHEERLTRLTRTAYTAETVRAMERPLLDEGAPLMRMAANAIAKTVLDTIHEQGWKGSALRITLLVGGADNGGDGLFAGAILASQGLHVTSIATGPQLHEEALLTFLDNGGHVFPLDPHSQIPGSPTGFSSGEAGQRLERAIEHARRSHILIDAMTGIGVNGALHGIPAALADALGADGRAPRRPALPEDAMALDFPLVVAVDTPSGIGVDDGSLPGAYIPADLTVMFGALKPCAMLPPAAGACGRTTLVDFGFDTAHAVPAVSLVDRDHAQRAIRIPLVSDGKYDRGVTGLITGSVDYPGAAVLSTTAAARCDIGMVRYLGPQRAQDLILQALPEATMGKGHVQSWVVGSGVPYAEHDTGHDSQRAAIKALLEHYALTGDGQADARARQMPPIVVDAGALDLLPAKVPPQVVLTPHAGEMARLMTRIDAPATSDNILACPLRYARRAHALTGATVLLKGAYTLIVSDDAQGRVRTLMCGRAPAWLATAGAGDALGGIIGAFLASRADLLAAHPSRTADVVAGAVYMHGLAAALASKSDQHAWDEPRVYGTGAPDDMDEAIGHPIVAGDVVDALPAAYDLLNTTAQYR
ncbi:MAG: bifunctional ADP-dependent NAD(P)H-hydrate dehydratase/NAD(P)H-hydrate epimerase [Bifidobacterium sp.]|nr:bifunctional ADP-dependent NAD(P)H-hydrate dehydratase/NAD(P)H-hydrate epimerase [Bifidobacterium sp.]